MMKTVPPMYEATLAIARRKLAVGVPGKALLPRLGTGGNFSDLFLWDTAFCAMWAKYHLEMFPVENSLDNFYRVQDDDGFIGRQHLPSGESKWSKEHPISFAPPILAWAELELHRTGSFPQRLAKVYEPLKKHHHYCAARYRRDDGLFFSDPFGCGMDNLPRWPGSTPDPAGGIPLRPEHIHATVDKDYAKALCRDPRFSWNRQCGWIDSSAQMAFNAMNLSRIAAALGKHAEEKDFLQQHRQISETINVRCWSERDAFYFDVVNGAPLRRFHCGAWWMLIAEAVPPARLERFVAHLTDPVKFGRPVPVPTLAADDPDYRPEDGYWLGPVWAPINYMILKGLLANEQVTLARRLALGFHDAVGDVFNTTGTIWENYSPEQRNSPPSHSQSDFCGWSALGPISIYREFIRNNQSTGMNDDD